MFLAAHRGENSWQRLDQMGRLLDVHVNDLVNKRIAVRLTDDADRLWHFDFEGPGISSMVEARFPTQSSKDQAHSGRAAAIRF